MGQWGPRSTQAPQLTQFFFLHWGHAASAAQRGTPKPVTTLMSAQRWADFAELTLWNDAALLKEINKRHGYVRPKQAHGGLVNQLCNIRQAQRASESRRQEVARAQAGRLLPRYDDTLVATRSCERHTRRAHSPPLCPSMFRPRRRVLSVLLADFDEEVVLQPRVSHPIA